MTVSREWVRQVEQVLAEVATRPRARATGSSEAWQRYQIEQQIQAPDALEQSHRARSVREINRIAASYGWGTEVARALDRAGASYLSDLHDQEVTDLADHMRNLLDCANTACDHMESLPAR